MKQDICGAYLLFFFFLYNTFELIQCCRRKSWFTTLTVIRPFVLFVVRLFIHSTRTQRQLGDSLDRVFLGHIMGSIRR